MHVVFDNFIVDMVMYDMQVWCGYVLSKVPMKFMTSRIVFAMVFMDMNYIYYLIGI
jgi:hypothetical protein